VTGLSYTDATANPATGLPTINPFLWERGVLTDLGTLGGSTGETTWINDAGEIVGEADLSGDLAHDAFLWKNGVMFDLGNLDKTSFAFSINEKGQVVGRSRVDDTTVHAFIWEKGGPMIDLNSLISAGASLELTDAFEINERGEIAGMGIPAGCSSEDECGHPFLRAFKAQIHSRLAERNR
jgi:probable HAF family extracellular repeat protein